MRVQKVGEKFKNQRQNVYATHTWIRWQNASTEMETAKTREEEI